VAGRRSCRQCARLREQVVRVVQHDRQDRTELDENLEGAADGVREVEQVGGDEQVRSRGDRLLVGEPFDDPQRQHFPPGVYRAAAEDSPRASRMIVPIRSKRTVERRIGVVARGVGDAFIGSKNPFSDILLWCRSVMRPRSDVLTCGCAGVSRNVVRNADNVALCFNAVESSSGPSQSLPGG
jgi:hypothetical protein